MRQAGLAAKASIQAIHFHLESYLRSRTLAVDRALEGYLKRYAERSKTIWQAMHYGLFPGGKRIRPILLLAAGELFHGRRSALLPFACAVEMIHGYSLIHDDLPALDNDDLRRGEPTNHKVYGEAMAILAGDALLTMAFDLISRPDLMKGLDPVRQVRIIHELAFGSG